MRRSKSRIENETPPSYRADMNKELAQSSYEHFGATRKLINAMRNHTGRTSDGREKPSLNRVNTSSFEAH